MNLIPEDWSVILLVSFFSHILLLFNFGRYWDSWILSAWQIRRDDKSLKRLFSDAGSSVWYYVHRFMGRLPHYIYCYNTLVFLNLLIQPILVFEICLHTNFLTREESLIIACFSIALPLAQMIVDYIIGISYFCTLTLFYAAWLLILPTMPTHNMPAIQVIACVLFFLSFNLPSLLMFFAWPYMINFLIQYQMDGHFTLHYFVHYATQTSHLLVLPFLFWILKKITPASGAYASYYKIALPKWSYLAERFTGLYLTSLYQIPIDAVDYVLKKKNLFLPLLFGTACLFYINPWKHYTLTVTLPYQNLLLFCLGLIGLALGGLPYLLVGQYFGNHGWITKNNTLLAVPTACCFTALLNTLIKPTWLLTSEFMLLGIFIIYWNYNYLRWYAISAKYNAILYMLGKIPDIHKYSVLGLSDHHYISAGSDEHPEHGHGCSTVSHMLSFINGHKPFCICFPDVDGQILKSDHGRYSKKTINDMIRFSTIDYSFTEVDLHGHQALVIIRGKENYSCEMTALLFFYFRFFRPNKLKKFYDRFVSMEFIPLSEVVEIPT